MSDISRIVRFAHRFVDAVTVHSFYADLRRLKSCPALFLPLPRELDDAVESDASSAA